MPMTLSKDIDGGYAWVVMFAFFLMTILVDGIRYSFGLYFIEFLEDFNQGKGVTAWIGSLMIATYNLAGPLFAFIVNKAGCRIACMVGSITTAVAFLLSAVVPDLFYLYITYGVLQGFGFGLMYLSGTVAVGRYFYKKRARALGFGLCGAGVGMLFLTPFVRFVIDTYAWRGSMFILAGLSLNACVLAMLIRPIDGGQASIECDIDDNKDDVKSFGKQSDCNVSIDDDQSRDNAQSESIRLFNDKTTHFVNVHSIENNKTHENLCPNVNRIRSCDIGKNDSDHSALLTEMEVPNSNDIIFCPNAPLLKPVGLQETVQLSTSIVSIHRSHASLRSVHMQVLSKRMSSASSEIIIEKPKRRVDRSELSKRDASDLIDDSSDDVTDGITNKKFSNSVIESMFPKVLVMNIDYQLFMVTCLLAGIPAFIPYSMLPDLALTSGATAAQSAWTLSAIGIGGIVSRIVGGWLSDMECINNLTLLTVCLCGCGVTAIIVAFFHAYFIVMAYSVCYGIFFGAVVIVQPIVFLEYLGEEYIAEIMGSLMFTYGITQFIGSPMAGGIFDATSSYTISFVVAGLLFLSAGVVNQCVMCTKYCRNKNGQDLQEENGHNVGSFELS